MQELQQRIINNVIRINGCWTWQLTKHKLGYGQIKYNGKLERAHRIAYLAFKGEIPEGLQIDHLCRRKDCVNPEHLEPVTAKENTHRSNNPAGINYRKTRCNRGHKFTVSNTYIDTAGKRSCKKCEKIWIQTYLNKQKRKCIQCVNITSGLGRTGLCKPCTNRKRALV